MIVRCSRLSACCAASPLVALRYPSDALLAGGRESFGDDVVGNAFFTLVQAASSTGWMNAFFAVNVVRGKGVPELAEENGGE